MARFRVYTGSQNDSNIPFSSTANNICTSIGMFTLFFGLHFRSGDRVLSSGDFVLRQSPFKDDSAERCSFSLPAHSAGDGKTCSTIAPWKRNTQAYLGPACLFEPGLLMLTVTLLLSAWRQDKGGRICSSNHQAYRADSPIVPHYQRCGPPLLLAGTVN